MMTTKSLGLPSPAELFDAPERAILAVLDTNLVLAVRALQARHPDLGDPQAREPLPLLAEVVLACAQSLRDVLLSYDELSRRAARLDCNDDEIDLPF